MGRRIGSRYLGGAFPEVVMFAMPELRRRAVWLFSLAAFASAWAGCADTEVLCADRSCGDAAVLDVDERDRDVSRDAPVDGAGDLSNNDLPGDAAEPDLRTDTPSCVPFDEICNGRDDDCDGLVDEGDGTCRDACCDPALVCDGRTGCEPTPCDGMRCGDGSLCCTGSDVCWQDACFTPLIPCEFREDCPEAEFCEPDLGRCVPTTGVSECTYVPPPGVFDPRVACTWTGAGETIDPGRVDVVATPIVINLTDDDGNGVTDRGDVPEIVFLTYDLNGDGCCNQAATLRIVSGACDESGQLQTIASINAPAMTNDSGIAAADLDGDGVAELLVVGRSGPAANDRPTGVIVFRRSTPDGRNWETFWHNETYPIWNEHTRGGATISVANLDGVGAPEVIVGNVVLNGNNGTLRWDGRATAGSSAGVGNNAFLGPASAVADIDRDGLSEVIAGNTVYGHDGVPRFTFNYTTNNSECGGNLPCDGFNAVANFDDDPEGEVVIVRLGEVFILEHTGALLWRARIPKDDCANNESGPPTIADFDGDGYPEIGTASSDFYVVLDRNTCDTPDWAAAGCVARNVLWRVANNDCSSRATGSSVFDFDGDGRAEVVYADEQNMRIFDGPTGTILFDDATHRSHTRIEMPVIADVDNDGNAEIVVPRNRNGGGVPGIVVIEDAADNWVRTRRIWNQHAYSITNITEDGTVPTIADVNWAQPRFNNFRQNAQPDDVFAAPNLTIGRIDVDIEGSKCPLQVEIAVQVVVRNIGALTVAPGVAMEIVVTNDAGAELASHRVTTATRLFPGTSDVYVHTFVLPPESATGNFAVTATIDGDEGVNECREDDNARTVAFADCART